MQPIVGEFLICCIFTNVTALVRFVDMFTKDHCLVNSNTLERPLNTQSQHKCNTFFCGAISPACVIEFSSVNIILSNLLSDAFCGSINLVFLSCIGVRCFPPLSISYKHKFSQQKQEAYFGETSFCAANTE